MEPAIASPTITPVPNAALVSADKTRTMTIPSRQKKNNLQIPLSSCADRHEVQIRCFKPVESRIAASNNMALLLLAWSTRRASQSAAPSGLDLGHVRPLSWEVENPSRPTTTLWEPSMTLTLHLHSFQQREMDQRMADAPANPK